MAYTLLTNVLQHFWDCCRIYHDHKEREPRRPEHEEGSRGGGNDRDWVDYERAHRPWEMNHIAHEDALSVAARLLNDSSFNDEEKTEIASRFALLEIHHKNDEVIMRHITTIRERQSLPEPAARV